MGKNTLVTTCAAAVASACLVGLAEGLHAAAGSALDRLAAALWPATLWSLPGLLVGLILVALWPLGRRAWTWLGALTPPDALAGALAAGCASFLFFVALVHVTHHFFTAYHNATLEAFALAAAILVLCAAALVLATVLFSASRPIAGRVRHARLAGVAVFVLAWLAPGAYGVAHGTTGGSGGVLGFLGILKKDELDLRPLGLLAAVIVMTPLLLRLGRRAPHALVGTACFFLGGLPATIQTYGARPAAADALERRAPVTRLLVAAGRRALDGDGDGYSARLGGGDCNDHDALQSPGADEVPGNGIDEDCSGADLPRRRGGARSRTAAPPGTTQRHGPPNLSIVLVTVDTLRADLGFTGYSRPISPRIDALAARGVAYERAYAISSYTGKALAPMLIGRFPSECHRDQQHFTRYFDQNVFVAEKLHEAGFATGAVLPHWYFRKTSGLAQGFDRWDLEAIPRGPGHIDVQSSSPEVTERALAMIGDDAFTRGRFFLWVHYLDPHREYLPHEGFEPFGTTRRDQYDGEVRFTDHHLGRLLDAIARAPWAAHTAIVLTSDHGEAFGEHDEFFHGRDLWDEMLRIPLVLSIPGVAPRRIARRTSAIDLAPTLYDLAEVPAPVGLSGASLLPEILGATTAERPVYAELPIGPFNDERRTLVSDGWKLIHIAAGNRYLLFHLDQDPGERHDLAATHPADLARMKEELAGFRAGLDRVDPEGE